MSNNVVKKYDWKKNSNLIENNLFIEHVSLIQLYQIPQNFLSKIIEMLMLLS